MSIKLKSVTEFASTVGGYTKARKILKAQGISVVGDYYDANRLAAAYAVPYWLTQRRKAWSLSHASGLGAVKHWLDPLKINIVEHECRGSQWLMLQGPSNSHSFVKMYYKGKLDSVGGIARFEIRNFLKDNAPSHYLCVCFEGPYLWCITAKELVHKWNLLQKEVPYGSIHLGGFHLPTEGTEHPGGFLRVSFTVDTGEHVLDTLDKIGLR